MPAGPATGRGFLWTCPSERQECRRPARVGGHRNFVEGPGMRVALKLILVMVLILAVVRVIEGVLTIQRETARLSAAVQRDAKLMDRLLRGFMAETWTLRGKDRAIELLESVNVSEHPVRMTWVAMDGEDGLRATLDPSLIERLAAGDTVMVGDPEHAGEKRHHVYTPLDMPDAAGAIRTTETLTERSRYLHHSLLREMIAGGFVVLFGGLAIVLWGFVSIGKPLQRLEQRIEQIGEGDLSNQLDARGHDELASLARGINTMCRRLTASYQRERRATEQRIAAIEQMRHTERLTTIGRLASGIAHELGTPLNVVTGRADMIGEGGLSSTQVREYARTIASQGSRMAGIIRSLLNFARQRHPQRAPTPVVNVIRQTIDLVASLGYKGDVRIDAGDEALSLEPEMDAGQMQQVLINLVENGLQAVPDGGEVVISVQAVDATPPAGSQTPPGRFVRIDVRDTGKGIAQEHLTELFDPFFTTKDVGEGTGLGLSIVHGIVSEHGGWIDVSSKVGEGSCFSVYLPYDGAS